MKLLVLTPTIGTQSGWATFSKAVVSRLRNRHDVRVVDDVTAPIDMKGHPVELLRAARHVRAQLDDVDALFSLVSYPYSAVAMLATLERSAPYFVSCHGTYAVRPLHTKHRFLARPSLRRAAGVFPVSEFTAGRIRDAIPGIDNITVVPNGVDPTTGDVESFDLDHRVVLTVGSFKPRKGQDNAVSSFATVADELPDVHHHLVGGGADGDYAAKVRRIADQSGISDRVHFEGHVSDEDLERWYATANLFLLVSRYVDHSFEGFPLVFLEANKYGVPAVGNRGTSAEDAIDDGRSGLLADDDPTAIGDAIKRVLADPDTEKRLGRGAREWAEEHDWDRAVDTFCERIERSTDTT
jgi:phosphatidylinositol alpha-1,6-mannosyltransferase